MRVRKAKAMCCRGMKFPRRMRFDLHERKNRKVLVLSNFAFEFHARVFLQSKFYGNFTLVFEMKNMKINALPRFVTLLQSVTELAYHRIAKCRI